MREHLRGAARGPPVRDIAGEKLTWRVEVRFDNLGLSGIGRDRI